MNLFEQMAIALQSLRFALGQMARPALWVPWLLLGLVQLGALFALCFAAHPAISAVMAPLVARLAGAHALHYPELFLALPALYGRLDLAIAALPGAVVLGASTALFRDAFLARPPAPGAALATALRRTLPLVLGYLPYHLLAWGWSFVLGGALGGHGGLVGRAAYVLSIAGSVLLQSVFLYVAALVVIEGRGWPGTLRSLPHTWRQGFWAALTLGMLLVLPLLPLNLLAGAGHLIVARGRPELLAVMTFAQLLVALVCGFLLSGATTLVFLGGIARRPARGNP